MSLQTGKTILNNLPEECEPVDIFISKEGIWHEKGLEKSPEKILHRVDAVINGLHGKYGEDGEVQNLLDSFNVPYTGSGALASALAMNKILSKKVFKNHGIKTPYFQTVSANNLSKAAISDAYHGMPGPFVVKPSSAGSSVGVRIVNTPAELEAAIAEAAQYSPAILIEEFISGREATCGVIDGFRDHDCYPLLPIEIKHKKKFFDYDAKYSDSGTEEICPGNFSHEISKEIEKMAIAAHRALGLRHYSRSDFIIHPRRGIYILETNSLPGLTENSLVPKALRAVGSSVKEFLAHLLHGILNRS